MTDADGAVVADSAGDDVLDFTPADSGDYTVAFTVADDDGGVTTVTRTLTVGNLDPTVTIAGPAAGAEGEPLVYTATGTDPAGDADPLTFAWTAADAAGVVVATGTGASFTFTPPDDGDYAVSVTADDGDGGTAADSVALAVANVDPVADLFVVAGPREEGGAIELVGGGADVAADPLAAAWTITGPDGAVAFEGTGDRVAFTPADDGVYRATLTVDDGDGGTDTTFADFTVANRAPTVTAAAAGGGSEGQPIALSATGADPAGAADPLTFAWTVTDADGAVVFAGSGANLAFTPADDGVFTATVTADDGDGGTATDSVTLTVANADPTLSVVRTTAAPVEGEPVTARLEGTDPAGANDPLTFAWAVTDAAGEEIAAGTGADVAFTPADDGTFTLTATAADGDGGTVTVAETFAVGNVAPLVRVDGLPDGPLPEGSAVTLTAAGTDVAADPLDFAWAVTDAAGAVVATGAGASFTFAPRRRRGVHRDPHRRRRRRRRRRRLSPAERGERRPDRHDRRPAGRRGRGLAGDAGRRRDRPGRRRRPAELLLDGPRPRRVHLRPRRGRVVHVHPGRRRRLQPSNSACRTTSSARA